MAEQDPHKSTLADAYHVFLSHNSNDKPAVRVLKAELARHSLRVWLDEDELRPGMPWQKLLEDGINMSMSVAVLVGNDGLGPWENEEMQGALRLAIADKRPVIPVLLPSAPIQPKLPMFLGNRAWVDLRAGMEREGLDRLIWGITGERPTPYRGLSVVATLEFVLDRPISRFNEDEFRGAFHQATGIDAARIRIVEIREGGTIVRAEADAEVIVETVRCFQQSQERVRLMARLSGLTRMSWSVDGEAGRLEVPARSKLLKIDVRPIPKAPHFYAEPDYIGSHKFVGRAAELQVLTDWAAPADPTNLLLFEAIGGNGKSMLTWEWTKNHALAARPGDAQWAGRFWYSFYERGAGMADFCRRALAYMTGRSLEEYAKKKTVELKDELIAQLHARPWLIILDGLERVLVAYHRIDAAEVRDEEVNIPTDKIVNRNPCDTIRDEDNDLIRALAAAVPSKLLISSRLTPRVLLNPAGQAIPGVKRLTLEGLRPPDAEALLRSCDVEGNSAAIQSYLAANCDNHPLVIGILGGLIANYLPARGNFDVWSTATDGGAALDLGSLDLIQRRNHILRAALAALPEAGRQLLSTLALLTESVDYDTLKAFNPHLPPELEEVEKLESPEEEVHWVNGKPMRWKDMSDEQKAELRKQYDVAESRWREYEKAAQSRLESAAFRDAPKKLQVTVKDLEQRGLLQWDGREKKYDLHPVIRGVASGEMAEADRERHGQRVLDHFTAQPHRPYEEAETMEDVHSSLHIIRMLLKLGHFQRAADILREDLRAALAYNLSAYAETLSLVRPFFPDGWAELPRGVGSTSRASLSNLAGTALQCCGEQVAALAAYGTYLTGRLEADDWENVSAVGLHNISECLQNQNRLAQSLSVETQALDIAILSGSSECNFVCRLRHFRIQMCLGQSEEAAVTWRLLSPMGRAWSRSYYRPGDAEESYARFSFSQGNLREEHVAEAERLAAKGKNREGICSLHCLRGAWRIELGAWALAAASYQEAVHLARERNLIDAVSEAGLTLAKHHLGQVTDTRDEAERLAQLRDPAHHYLAMLWLAIGDKEKAKHHALAAYTWAWADGEPYVRRYELSKAAELLQQMNVPVPSLPSYDPAKDKPFPWEADVRAAIEKLRAEKNSAKPKAD